MGCSNPHPHGQVWAGDAVPEELAPELKSFGDWKGKQRDAGHGGRGCLLCDYTHLELEKKVRVVCENEGFVVVVPYWAYWPFEVLVLPKRHASQLSKITEQEKTQLAAILKVITVKYDNLFETSFPYSMGLHQEPASLGPAEHPDLAEDDFHLHFHFYPPLLRNASVK